MYDDDALPSEERSLATSTNFYRSSLKTQQEAEHSATATMITVVQLEKAKNRESFAGNKI